jgi:hypothetical protein
MPRRLTNQHVGTGDAIQGLVPGPARVKQDLLARLKAFGLASKIGSDRLYPTLPTAVDAYQQWTRDHPTEGRLPTRG